MGVNAPDQSFPFYKSSIQFHYPQTFLVVALFLWACSKLVYNWEREFSQVSKVLDLNLIRVFIAVFQHASYTLAGRELNLSQPAVSLAIRRFEEQIGTTLFVKQGRGIAPTSRAMQLADELQYALQLIENSVSLERDVVAYCVEAVLHVIGDISGISFKLPAEDQDQVLNDLRANKVELIVDVTTSKDSAFIIEELMQEDMVVLCRQGHPRLTGDQISKEQFYQEGHIVLKTRREGRQFLELFAREPLEARDDKIEVSAISGLAMMVAQTDYIGLVSESFANLWATKLGLKVFPLPVSASPVLMHMMYHKRHLNDPHHARMREAIRQQVKKHQRSQRADDRDT